MIRATSIAVIGLVVLGLQAKDAASQEMATSLSELAEREQLREGDGLYVTVVSGRRIKADLHDLTSDALTLRARLLWTNHWETLRFAEDEVVRVERQDSRWNGFHNGFGGALGASALFGVGFERPETALLYLGAVAGGSGLVGAIVDGTIHAMVYEGPRARAGAGPATVVETRKPGGQIVLVAW